MRQDAHNEVEKFLINGLQETLALYSFMHKPKQKKTSFPTVSTRTMTFKVELPGH